MVYFSDAPNSVSQNQGTIELSERFGSDGYDEKLLLMFLD